MSDGLIMVNSQGVIIPINKALERITVIMGDPFTLDAFTIR
jgi:hypothetical protein